MDGDKDLPSIEDEFSELDREMKRIAAMPTATPEQQNALLIALESLREDYNQKLAARTDGPEWRRVVDAGVTRAFDGLILDLRRKVSFGGNVQLDSQMVQQHLEPVFFAVAAALQKNLVEKFGKRPPPGTPPPKVDGADLAAMLFTLFGPAGKKKP